MVSYEHRIDEVLHVTTRRWTWMAFLVLGSWFGQHWIHSELDNVMVPLFFITHILSISSAGTTASSTPLSFPLNRWADDF
jgi:hypothetical protein